MTNKKNPEMEQHHIFYPQKKYKGKLSFLRESWYCKVKIPKGQLHKELHGRVLTVPTPSLVATEGALFQLYQLESHGAIDKEDTLEERLLLLAMLFDCSAQPTADALREQYKVVCEFKKAP